MEENKLLSEVLSFEEHVEVEVNETVKQEGGGGMSEEVKSYVDNGDVSTLSDSKKYTDESREMTNSEILVIQDIIKSLPNKDYIDDSDVEALNAANKYTDYVTSSLPTHNDVGNGLDTYLQMSASYTDESILKFGENAIDDYKTILSDANKYTDDAIALVPNKDYIDGSITTSVESQKTYIDNKVKERVLKEVGKGLSSNDYTDIEKSNLSTAVADIDTLKTDLTSFLRDSKGYTDEQISNLIGTAPEMLNTLEEIAQAIIDNKDVITALNESIASKLSTEQAKSLYVALNGYIPFTSAEKTKLASLVKVDTISSDKVTAVWDGKSATQDYINNTVFDALKSGGGGGSTVIGGVSDVKVDGTSVVTNGVANIVVSSTIYELIQPLKDDIQVLHDYKMALIYTMDYDKFKDLTNESTSEQLTSAFGSFNFKGEELNPFFLLAFTQSTLPLNFLIRDDMNESIFIPLSTKMFSHEVDGRSSLKIVFSKKDFSGDVLYDFTIELVLPDDIFNLNSFIATKLQITNL